MKTLLTGFGPFGAVVSNPTQRLVEHYSSDVDGRSPVADVDSLLLPTSFSRAPRILLHALAGARYDRVVMLGVAANTPHFRVECFAHNVDEGGAYDVDGFAPPVRRIASASPHRLQVTIDPTDWLHALSAIDVPVALSESAGGFLCNHALFHALRFSRGRTTQIGFLHVPADEHTGVTIGQVTSFSTHVRAVRALLEL